MIVFGYRIVAKGGDVGQALITGTLYIKDVESAKQHVQTVAAPGVVPQSGLEVILQDLLGSEIWRGPYLGRA
jgi:hypothetical protein